MDIAYSLHYEITHEEWMHVMKMMLAFQAEGKFLVVYAVYLCNRGIPLSKISLYLLIPCSNFYLFLYNPLDEDFIRLGIRAAGSHGSRLADICRVRIGIVGAIFAVNSASLFLSQVYLKQDIPYNEALVTLIEIASPQNNHGTQVIRQVNAKFFILYHLFLTQISTTKAPAIETPQRTHFREGCRD